MDPRIVSTNAESSLFASSDSLQSKIHVSSKEIANSYATINVRQDNPFDFFRNFYESMIAGGTAGVVVEAALYPIDTIKTRLQAARAGGKIVLKSLYSGLGGNLAGVLPASALFIGVYEPTKQKLLENLPANLSAFAHLTAGALGGAASSIVRAPTEVVKQRMQIGQFATAPDAVRLIIAKEGLSGLYTDQSFVIKGSFVVARKVQQILGSTAAGFGSFLFRDLPFDAIQFCLYEQLKIGFKHAAKREPKDPENAMLGAFAGAMTGALTTPLDVIKTRLMVGGNQYKGVSDCVKTILKEEGHGALWKGIGPRVLWVGIGGAVFFGVLEKTKQIISERRHMAAPLTGQKMGSVFIDPSTRTGNGI